MLSRRTLFKAISTLPFAFFANSKAFSHSHFEYRLPTYEDYSTIDYAIADYIKSAHGLRLKIHSMKIPREYIQLYSNVYRENHEQFLSGLCSALLHFEIYSPFEKNTIENIDWRKIKSIIDEQARKLGIIIWYTPYSQNSYSWLDNYLSEHIEEHYKSILDKKHVEGIRHYSQCRHFIYHEPQPMFFTINGVTMNTVDVVEWILKWEGLLNPFWL